MNHDLLVDGTCWACGLPYLDHTVAQLDRCLDAPLALEIVEGQEAPHEQ
jgi:hypothetical protein